MLALAKAHIAGQCRLLQVRLLLMQHHIAPAAKLPALHHEKFKTDI